jgi:hypothetical protein
MQNCATKVYWLIRCRLATEEFFSIFSLDNKQLKQITLPVAIGRLHFKSFKKFFCCHIRYVQMHNPKTSHRREVFPSLLLGRINMQLEVGTDLR